jgi:hypothetical protein
VGNFKPDPKQTFGQSSRLTAQRHFADYRVEPAQRLGSLRVIGCLLLNDGEAMVWKWKTTRSSSAQGFAEDRL